MAVSLITRLLTLALGYAYPAYACYKTLELHPPKIEQLIFWCQYWVLVATLTVVERFADFAVSWLPMYGEAKLLLVLYLWHPGTRGAGHVYDGFLRPLVARHEVDIDRGLLELRARAKDVTASQLKAAAAVGQAWLVEAARLVSSQMQAARSGRAGAAH
uniref:HVA22-like protein n=2 Tax=Hordeum vulgare subsp. vulgare TaxID=112509 RepID=A0A8I7B9K1_HORVV